MLIVRGAGAGAALRISVIQRHRRLPEEQADQMETPFQPGFVSLCCVGAGYPNPLCISGEKPALPGDPPSLCECPQEDLGPYSFLTQACGLLLDGLHLEQVLVQSWCKRARCRSYQTVYSPVWPLQRSCVVLASNFQARRQGLACGEGNPRGPRRTDGVDVKDTEGETDGVCGAERFGQSEG